MPRGAAGAAKKSLETTNAIGADQQKRANALEGKIMPGYTNLADTGYFDPEEAAAATTNEMGAATAPFGTAEFESRNRAAATRNAADVSSEADKLALEEGQVAGQAAGQLQQEKMAGQLAGEAGLADLYKTNVGESESMYGLAPSTINAYSNAQMNNPMLHLGETIISAAGQAGGGYLAHH